MGILDWIIIIITAVLLFLAARAWKRKGSCGSGCSGDCANCELKDR